MSFLQTESEGLVFYTPFCSSRSSVLLSKVHRRGGIDTDFDTDGSLSNQEGNTTIKHVVFWVSKRLVILFLVWSNFTAAVLVCSLGFIAMTLWEMLDNWQAVDKAGSRKVVEKKINFLRCIKLHKLTHNSKSIYGQIFI